MLLTGDGVSQEILDGLARHGKLDANGRIHVNVLKVQHHGALANVEADFVKRVTADHYVFCGNGAHHNPEIEVVEAFAKARLTGIDGERTGRAGGAVQVLVHQRSDDSRLNRQSEPSGAHEGCQSKGHQPASWKRGSPLGELPQRGELRYRRLRRRDLIVPRGSERPARRGIALNVSEMHWRAGSHMRHSPHPP